MRDHSDGEVDGDLPMSITIRSDDLPDLAPDPAWHRPDPVERCLDSTNFDRDNPDALREGGPVAVASGLLLLARWGRYAPWRTVRQVSELIIRHLTGDLRGEGLELAIGLRRRDGGPDLALQFRRAERDALLLGLARTVFAELGPWSSAAAIREAISAYELRRWNREQHRHDAPGDQIGAAAWRILRLKLPQGAVPRQDDLARVIRQDREDC